ncbi:hypothetical protein EVA_18904 [gut metagenome]|uniref:Uncharacterized protein n=1 Tax=gut metagenome TaxID=749906 RepID=J9BZJ5_9ZZZZ
MQDKLLIGIVSNIKSAIGDLRWRFFYLSLFSILSI